MRAPIPDIIGIAPNGERVYFENTRAIVDTFPVKFNQINHSLRRMTKLGGWEFLHGVPGDATSKMTIELLASFQLRSASSAMSNKRGRKMTLEEYKEQLRESARMREEKKAESAARAAKERKEKREAKRLRDVEERKMKNADRLAAMKAKLAGVEEIFADYDSHGIPHYYDAKDGDTISSQHINDILKEMEQNKKERAAQERAIREGWKVGRDDTKYGPFICPKCGAVINDEVKAGEHKKLHLAGVEIVRFRGGIIRANI